jgi:hypothetical protein
MTHEVLAREMTINIQPEIDLLKFSREISHYYSSDRASNILTSCMAFIFLEKNKATNSLAKDVVANILARDTAASIPESTVPDSTF